MVAIDRRETVSQVLNKLFDFVKSDQFIAEDVKKYANAFITTEEQAKNVDIEGLLLAYVFERKIDDKFVMDLFIEKQTDLSDEEKEIIDGLKKSIYSIFEIKKVLKNGFELYNIVNEKTYPTSTIIKSSNFRGVGSGEYILGRIFPCKETNYLIVLNKIFPSAAKTEVFRYAVMMQMEKPEAVYQDNETKFQEIEKMTKELATTFQEYFNSLEIVTTTENLDEILAGFNDFVESGEKTNIDKLPELIKQPDEYKYFDINEVSKTQEGDFIDQATKGFSSAPASYDVGLMYDAETGLLVVPFYATFREIFKREDYKSVEGYQDCIKEIFNNDKVPPSVIEKVYNEFSSNFMNIVKEVLEETELQSLDELLKKYKKDYYTHRKFSVPTMLYSSEAFNELMYLLQEEQLMSYMNKTTEKVGRNDSCPCGSGKKYKKCCM